MDHLHPVAIDASWGFIDRHGSVRIPPRFSRAHGFAEGLAAVRVGSDWGYIDASGAPVVAAQFGHADDFTPDGFAVAGTRHGLEVRCGVIDRTGRYVIEPKYESLVLCTGQGLVLCERDGQFAAIDLAGNPLCGPCDDFEDAATAATQAAYHFDEETGLLVPVIRDDTLMASLAEAGPCHRVYLADESAYALVNAELDLLSDLYPVMGVAAEGRVPICAEERWGYLDFQGQEVVPLTFDHAEAFSEGLAAVRQDDAWGFVDAQGSLVIPTHFEVAWSFSDGLARVETREGTGYIDSAGAFVWHPRD